MTDNHQGQDLSAIVKAYDIRGDASTQLTEEVARAFGAAFADHLGGEALIVAHDMRVSSPALARAFRDGAARRGATVADAGLSSTDQLYCASGIHRAAGAMITASHNPAPDNGIKLCLPGAKPISRATGLDAMRQRAEHYLRDGDIPAVEGGRITPLDTLTGYIDTLCALVPLTDRRPLRVAVDAANAMAGLTVPALAARLPWLTIIPLYFELDGTFPHHEANPLDPGNLTDLRHAVREHHADIGLAFDGDADRCVLIDEHGDMVSPSAVTALIAQREIARARAGGEERPAVVANLVSSRHVTEAIAHAGGQRIRSRVGHSLIKALMAEHDAVFGGEHSAHYYFRDFYGADSGLLAALHILAALTETDAPLSELVAEHDPYVSSGEINTRVDHVTAAIERVRAAMGTLPGARTDDLDGLTVEHWDDRSHPAEQWWFSLRPSNTEPLLRVNVEAAQEETMTRIRDEVLATIRQPQSSPGVPHTSPAALSGADLPEWVRERLVCPVCHGALSGQDDALVCTQCGASYRIEGGIPLLIASR